MNAITPQSEPGPRQGYVWDFPQPERIESVSEKLRVVFDERTVVETSQGFWLLETAYPPVCHFPAEDVDVDFLIPIYCDRFCEYLEPIRSWTIDVFGIRLECAAWSYPNPAVAYRKMKGGCAFDPSRVDTCRVGPECARAQDRDFSCG
ncbi:MAG: hypothetical protein CMP23_11140 [Rickettsiales bacterium]|nr:hypothetical protein [Rickettsiales bacterium]